MTTFILDPEDPFDPDDFIAELDRDLKAEKKIKGSAPAQKKSPVPAPFVQQWFPHAVVMHTTNQNCTACNAVYGSIDGIFLQDIHRNGALQSKRHVGGAIPEDYRYLPYTLEINETTVPCCPDCFATPPRPETAAPQEPHRASVDDPDLPTFESET